MNTTRSPLRVRAALACAALTLTACSTVITQPGEDAGFTSGASSSSGGAYDACTTPADCAWSEIDHEILSPSECVCLLGCPSIPLSKATVDRRKMQYQSLCTPGKDAHGNPCPVDDCGGPPKIDCKNGRCAAAAAGP